MGSGVRAILPDVDFGGVDLANLLLWLVVLLFSLSVHESAHAWSADRLGDPTARMLGRVTLNPISHIDPIGTLLFPVLTSLLGGVIFGWAKPVPVNPFNLAKPRFHHALIAAAGPASNVLLGLVCLAGLQVLVTGFSDRTLGSTGILFALVEMFRIGLLLNVVLAVFNLFPIPPLDGGWILAGVLPESMARWVDAIRPYGFVLLVVLLYSGVFYAVLGPVLAAVWSLIPS